MKRSGKFYRKNESDVMKELGLEPTPNSGSGWIIKEDGQNDYLICQLKSTDAQSIKINQKDIRILEKNAVTAHKIPIFCIQFLNTGECWLMAKPEQFIEVAEILNGCIPKSDNDILNIDNDVENESINITRKIKSSGNARLEYQKEQDKKYDKTKSAR